MAVTVAAPLIMNSKDRLKAGGIAFFWLNAFYVVYCARPEDWFSPIGILPLAKITGVAAVLAFIFAGGKGNRKFRQLPIESYFLLVMLVILMVSSIFSPVWKGGAISRTLDFAKVWIIFVLTFLLVTNLPKFRRIVYIQAASVPVICLLSVVKGRHTARLDGVLGGIYSNPNDLAFAVALSFPFCLMFFLTAKTKFRKALWIAGMLIMGAALVMTASRGGFITMVVTGTVCLWHFGVKGKRFFLIVASGFVALVLLMVAGGTMRARFASLWSERSDLHTREQRRAFDSFEQRQFLIDRSIEGIKEYPILGIGTRNFETYSTVWREVHMTYLQICVEGGIPSLILFSLFFLCGFINLRRVRKRKNLDPELVLFTGALHSVLVGFIVGALFSPEAYQFFPFFAVAYTSALVAYVQETERAAPVPAKPNRQFSAGRYVAPARVPVNT